MKYKIRRASNLKRRNIFDTYELKKRIEFSKGEALPLLIRIGHRFMFLGGMVGFWASSILMGIKGAFGFKRKVDRFSLNNKVVELRVKKH
tara:strand:- start:967 stop:1236 length:270 start_codon:yes stop_codon:yes gene_type:complete